MATTWLTPGTASSLLRRSYSAKARRASGLTVSSLPATEISMISPVSDDTGASSAWVSSGRFSRTADRRSPIWARAR